MTSTKAFRLGLIGHPVSHSKSPEIFAKFFEQHFHTIAQLENFSLAPQSGTAEYQLFDLPDLTQFNTWLEGETNNPSPLVGFNVTVPHKTAIIPYLDELSPAAHHLQAVNTVIIQHNPDTQKPHLVGHNTDVIGFEKSLEQILNITPSTNHNTPKLAIILGNGGSAKAVRYVLNQHHIPNQNWHRGQILNPVNPALNEAILLTATIPNHTLIVQTTPVGMWPNTEDCLDFPFEQLNDTHWVIDLIYNPETTAFMKNCIHRGATVMNGKCMLQKQAEAAWEIFHQNL
jgi:shikimate dehydrogenase